MNKNTATRPAVSLTVGRWATTGELVKQNNPDSWKSVMEVLDYQGESSDLTKIVYVCLHCRSIGVTMSEENRNKLVDNVDFKCCQKGTRTVTFHTEEV